jgi:transposase
LISALAALPRATVPVRLHLHTQRFFCDTPACGQRTFTERVPTVARPYAHTITQVSQAQCDTGLALGGAAGARQLARQGLPGSRQSVLRRVRDYQPTPAPAPRVIDIDDWAYRKGHRYGAIVVYLEQGCPVDLLEDRLAVTVATWLRVHPEVIVVTRDRADAYASGVTQGAPDAVQVADRWPLSSRSCGRRSRWSCASAQSCPGRRRSRRRRVSRPPRLLAPQMLPHVRIPRLSTRRMPLRPLQDRAPTSPGRPVKPSG